MKVVITGASSGFGQVLYERYKIFEYTVVGVSRRGPDIEADLSNKRARDVVISKLKADSEYIDLLINNAGEMILDEDSYASCVRMVGVNLLAVWDLTRNLVGKMGRGSNIINIASVSGVVGDEDVPLYSATKAGVIVLTKAFAKKFAKRSIKVNCISPGLFDDTNLVPSNAPEELTDSIPLEHTAKKGEIVRVVNCILESPFMTGANIVLDGGYSL